VLINKLQRNIKKRLLSKHTLTAVFSCLLLIVCDLLSFAVATEQPFFAAQQKITKASASSTRMKQDPTRPPSVIVQQLAPELAIKPEYELTAIFTRNNNQYAVVNGKVVKAGDPVADMLVTEISASNLTLQHSPSAQDTPLAEIVVIELNGSVNVKKQVIK